MKNCYVIFIRFLSTCLCDRRFFLLKKILLVADFFSFFFFFFFVAETVFMWQKCVSLTETQTEICFCDGKLFSKGNILSFRNCCLKEYLCPKYPVLSILYVISEEKFPWEIGVSVISDNRDNHFVGTCLSPVTCHMSPTSTATATALPMLTPPLFTDRQKKKNQNRKSF